MRITRDQMWLEVARVISRRATCKRRAVGCVLVDAKSHVISTGYNGPAAGMLHCTDIPCPGASEPSGTSLDECVAVHAEQNALVQCRRPMEIVTCYVTAAPCVHCVKMLLATTCEHITFIEDYPHARASSGLWTGGGRTWTQRRVDQ